MTRSLTLKTHASASSNSWSFPNPIQKKNSLSSIRLIFKKNISYIQVYTYIYESNNLKYKPY